MRFWAYRAFAALAVAVLAGAACGGNASPGAPSPASGPPRPAAVSAAPLVEGETVFGAASAPPDSAHLFFSLSCVDGLLTVVTTKELVYAELPCDRSLPPAIVEGYLGKPVRIRVVPGQPSKLYLESTAGSAEFTVGRVWSEPR